ncbi:hypothetical protein FD724_07215 [Nostoc sp. C057]|uniref:hypothetical protein n=1 Tax=Nostoc sp. C057 TaxID=2576903 RepID=UPI0015C3A934|nr:hypothetical protein [Nostoc sp. C057]QLE47819.1 hypothetical protein FD724_06650 [Nostoc sp. C057]QLE47925.1 hypothetical protein FD724_07215 [Nostoc sp. C057]
MSASITLYSPDGKRTREIAAIDAPGWIQAGWLREPPVILPVIPTPVPTPTPELEEPVLEEAQASKRSK